MVRTVPALKGSRRGLLASSAGIAALGILLAACATPSPAPPGPEPAPGSAPRTTGYLPVDGIDVYYEVHGAAREGKAPLVLLHGGLVAIDMSFGGMIPRLAADRQVIAIEQQGHGHTADRSGPLSYDRMAADTVAVLRHLGVGRADVFGYSMGGVTALKLGIQHPDLVRKLVVASAAFDKAGYYPGVLEGIAAMSPDNFAGSGLPEIYASVAPDPGAWTGLVEKVKQLDLQFQGVPPEQIASIAAATLVIVGDSDDVSIAHAARLFELLGGGTPGDHKGLPDAQLTVLPATGHLGVLTERSDAVVATTTAFLDRP
ncbi:alpha/beta fold hydrolase [Pseudonocardia sp. TRM90224]|uniref:alpha/beta fold hydrolase n=1 Tax=Pseudonocardia sp. TRM90224 TaxID=2812678 RepID=UPI001E5D63D6|nr:alpha/beta hydrolase [Pseudonocardia sp. TRM90224]